MDRCDKHDETMGRIFTEIEAIKVQAKGMDAKLDQVIEFKKLVHSIIFGNGKEGLVSKVSRVFNILPMLSSRFWHIA